MMTRMPVAMAVTPQPGLPLLNAHAAQPKDSEVSSVTKIRWKAFSDISIQWVAVPTGKSVIAHSVNPNRPMTKITVNIKTV